MGARSRLSTVSITDRNAEDVNIIAIEINVLPNCISMNLVTMTMSLGGAVLCESSLSFLGMGINPPTATWGSMVSSGYAKMATYPLLAIAPGIAIMILVLCFSIIGDAVRDALDPKLRGTIGVSKRKRLINKVKEMASADHAAEILAEGSDSNG